MTQHNCGNDQINCGNDQNICGTADADSLALMQSGAVYNDIDGCIFGGVNNFAKFRVPMTMWD